MGMFRKTAPDDALINEFWSWFTGFEGTMIEIVRGFGSGRENEEKAYQAIMILSEWMNRICFKTKKLVDFEFGGDADGRLELVFYPDSRYLRDNIERMAELMPSEIKERWDIIIH